MKFLLIVLLWSNIVHVILTSKINSTLSGQPPIDLEELTSTPQFLDFTETSTEFLDQDLDLPSIINLNNSSDFDDLNSNSTVRKTRSYHDSVFNIEVEEPRNTINTESQNFNQNFGQINSNMNSPPQNSQNFENPQNTHYTMTGGEKGSDFHSELTGSSSTYQINPNQNLNGMNYGQSNANNAGEMHQIHHSNGQQPIIIKCQAFARAEAGTSTSTSSSTSNSNGQNSNSNSNSNGPTSNANNQNNQKVPPQNGRFRPQNGHQNGHQNQNGRNPGMRGHHEVSFSMRANQMANFAREARVPISNLIHQIGNNGQQHVRFSTPNGIRHEESSFMRPSSY